MKKDALLKLLNDFYDAVEKENEILGETLWLIKEMYGEDVMNYTEIVVEEMYYSENPNSVMEYIEETAKEMGVLGNA